MPTSASPASRPGNDAPLTEAMAASASARGLAAAAIALLPLLAAAGCQPDDVTGARDQIGRGGERVVSYRVPLASEAYGALRFLEGVPTEALEDRIVGVAMAPDSVRARVGGDLSDDGRARIEAWDELDSGSVDLGELDEAVAASEVRTAPVRAALRSTASVPVRLVAPRLAAVRLDASGDPIREADGGLDLEEDASGEPITVPLAGSPDDSLVLGPGETVRVEREGAPLVDRLVELAVEGVRVAPVLQGDVRAAAGDLASLRTSDAVVLGHRLLVGLDLVLPDSGVVVRRTELGDGLGLSDPDVASMEERVLSAGGTLAVANAIPFRVRTEVAWVRGDRTGSDVFADPERVTLDSLMVSSSAGDGSGGRVDTLTVSLTGSEVEPLLRELFTAGVRIRLLPAAGSGGRGALRVDQRLDVDARASVELRAGDDG